MANVIKQRKAEAERGWELEGDASTNANILHTIINYMAIMATMVSKA